MIKSNQLKMIQAGYNFEKNAQTTGSAPAPGFWKSLWGLVKGYPKSSLSLGLGVGTAGAAAEFGLSRLFGSSSDTTPGGTFDAWLYPGLIGAGLGLGGGLLYDMLFGDEDADEKAKKQHLKKSLIVGALLGTLATIGPKLLALSSPQNVQPRPQNVQPSPQNVQPSPK